MKDQAEPETKVAQLEGKGTVGPGVDGSSGEFPSLIESEPCSQKLSGCRVPRGFTAAVCLEQALIVQRPEAL